MEYNGNKVYTADEFVYDKANVGDYVEQEVVDDMLDALPPACMRSSCSQLGEPHSDRQDPDTGKWRATYPTFKKVCGTWNKGDEIWEYCGNCFRGENVERGKDPVYVQEAMDYAKNKEVSRP